MTSKQTALANLRQRDIISERNALRAQLVEAHRKGAALRARLHTLEHAAMLADERIAELVRQLGEMTKAREGEGVEG